MKDALRFLLSLVYPSRCCLCGQLVTWREHMCDNCRTDAPYVLPPICDLCGRGVNVCHCDGKRHAYERCIMPFYYDGVGHTAVAILKNQGYICTVEGLAQEMAEVVRREYGGIAFDYVTSVPLNTMSLRKRGFNQSELLAKSLATRIGVPYQPLLVKLFATPAQKQQTRIRRAANLLGAFDVIDERSLINKTVLLVDDLHTTGATLHECAKMLKIYGAEQVYCVTATAAVLQKSE